MLRHERVKSKSEQIAELEALPAHLPQTELDLTAYKDVLTDPLLEQILSRVNNVTKLILDDCTHLTDKVPFLIAEKCPNISYLSTKNMPWHKWSTEGYFSDSVFGELQTLCLEGCSQLNNVYIRAPKLKNADDIIKVVHTIKYTDWRPDSLSLNGWSFFGNAIYKSYHYEPPIVTIKINKEEIDTSFMLKAYLAENLKNNTIEEITLNHWGNSDEFINTIKENIANNTSLKSLSVKGKLTLKQKSEVSSLIMAISENKFLIKLDLSHNKFGEPCTYFSYDYENFIKLLNEHPTLEVVDLSHNYLSAELVVDILGTKIKKLNVANNYLIDDHGLNLLTRNLENNHSLAEINLDDHLPLDWSSMTPIMTSNRGVWQYKSHDYFSDASLISFFNMLTHQQTLESFSIAGYFTDQSAAALENVLKNNKKLTHINIRQHSHHHTEYVNGRPRIVYDHHITNEGAAMFAKGIRQNTTLTSLKLNDMFITAKGFKAIADAIEKNTNLTECDIVLFKPFMKTLTEDQLSAIQLEQARIQSYIMRNQQLLEKPMVDQHPPRTISTSPLTLLTKPQNILEQKTPLSTNVLSLIPDDAPADLQLKFAVACCNELVSHIQRLEATLNQVAEHADLLDKEIDRDKDSKDEMEVIDKNPKLKKYYVKLCELSHFIKAGQSIKTMLVGQRDDWHDTTGKVTAIGAKASLAFFHGIPVVATFSCLFDASIEAVELAAHKAHSISKQRRAENLVSFTEGLEGGEERLMRRFARKMTLANIDKILHAESYLDSHPQSGLLKEFMQKTKKLAKRSSLALRQFREGHTYLAEEKLALADLLKIIHAITEKTISPPETGTAQERMDQLLEMMLDFMNPRMESCNLRLGTRS